MGEDVDEQPCRSARSQPAMRASSVLVVAHVLEHLDRDDAVEAAAGSVEVVHVRGDHARRCRGRARALLAAMKSRCGRELETAMMRARG